MKTGFVDTCVTFAAIGVRKSAKAASAFLRNNRMRMAIEAFEITNRTPEPETGVKNRASNDLVHSRKCVSDVKIASFNLPVNRYGGTGGRL